MHKTIFSCCVLFFILSFIGLSAQDASRSFRIADVTYDIKGATRKFPLSRAVPIDTAKVFPDQASFDFYLKDIQLQLLNQRVLESVALDTSMDEPDANGVITVHLTVHTVDTWNIIALPYPKFDSNSGFQFKLKLKDYNFFGSMQEFNVDLVYGLDNDNKSELASELDFSIPFEFHGYAMSWNNSISATFPEGVVPQFNIGTGVSIDVPVAFTKIVFGLDNKLVVNDRHDVKTNGVTESVLYKEDPFYVKETFSAAIPFTLWKFPLYGDLVWKPNSSVSTNIASGGMHDDDLRGTTLIWGHQLSVGRVNWYGNFRHGGTVTLSNDYSYNLQTSNVVAPSISGTATAFYSFFDHFGINSRLNGFHNLSGKVTESLGEPIRGILNSRIDANSAVSLNIDIPIKVLDVDFEDLSGVHWTRYIGFDLQIAPFFDMMLTHDNVTGRYYSLKDGWYSGGFELLIFPKKMRSIFGRISYGQDLGDMAKNGWKIEKYASRDEASTKELFIGLGLAY